ncbi:MAG: GNAT family N-acetyltransferase [Fimbriimonadaceae bacterium]
MSFDFSGLRLTTDRLELRAWQIEDVPGLFRLRSNPEVMKYWTVGPYQDLAQAEKTVVDLMAVNREGSGLELAVFSEAELIGTATLHGISWPSRRAELGYMLLPEFQGRGLMHEALVAIVNYGFGELGLNRLEADIDPRNVASRRSLERLGFKLEGFMPERWIVEGEVTDTEFFGLVAKDWKINS